MFTSAGQVSAAIQKLEIAEGHLGTAEEMRQGDGTSFGGKIGSANHELGCLIAHLEKLKEELIKAGGN